MARNNSPRGAAALSPQQQLNLPTATPSARRQLVVYNLHPTHTPPAPDTSLASAPHDRQLQENLPTATPSANWDFWRARMLAWRNATMCCGNSTNSFVRGVAAAANKNLAPWAQAWRVSCHCVLPGECWGPGACLSEGTGVAQMQTRTHANTHSHHSCRSPAMASQR